MSKTQALDLGSWHEPLFTLVDQKSLISVSHKIEGYVTFKLLLLIKNLEMSIQELKNVQEESDQIEEEKKLSAEEISKRWGQLAETLNLFSKQMDQIKRDFIFRTTPEIQNLYINIRHRLTVASNTISQLAPDLGL